MPGKVRTFLGQLALFALVGATALAQSTTWTGAGGTSNWNDAANWSAGVPSATTSALINTGSVSTAGAPSPTCLNLTIQSPGSLLVDAGSPLAVHGNASSNNAPTGAGSVRCVGSGTISGSWNHVEIASSYTFSSGSVLGDLLQTGGTLRIGTGTVTVSGNATFQGVSVNGFAGGSTLNVRGGITWSTSATVDLTSAMAIRCGGAFVTNGNFQPTTGLVTFDGGTTQLVSGQPLRFFDLRLSASSNVQVGSSGTVTIARLLTIDAASTLALTAATTLSVASTLANAGTLQAPLASLVAGAQCTFTTGGSTTLGAGQTHVFQSGLTVDHAFQPGVGSLVRMQGAGTLASSGLGSVGDVEIVGTYTLANLTVTGSLDYPATATGQLTIQGLRTILVNGNASLLGDRVNGSSTNPGTLNVRGNVVFDTVNPTVFSNTTRVNIQCGGAWSAGSTFAPTIGSVTFNGGVVQSASPTGAGTSLAFFDLVVATGSTLQVSTATSLNTAGALTVQANATLGSASLTLLSVGGVFTGTGTTSLPNAQLQQTGACTFAVGGSTTLGPGLTHTFQGDLTVSHAFQAGAGSVIRLQGTGFATTSGLGAFGDLEVLGTYTLRAMTVQGNLTYPIAAVGQLTIQGGQTVLVNGNASLLGNRLNGNSGTAGTLNVRGNVVMDTVNPTVFSTTTRVNLQCGGAWTSSANFAPTIGSVTFNGGVVQTATPAGSATSLTFFDLVVATGSTLQVVAATSLAPLGAVTVQSNATLTSTSLASVAVGGAFTNSGTTSLPNTLLQVTGACSLSSGGSTTLGAGQVHTFQSGLTVAHALQAGVGSSLRMVGTGTVSSSGVGAVPDLEIAGTNTLGGLTVQGNLTYLLTATGPLTIQGGQTILVNGNASFLGDRVNGGSTSTATLNVRGNLTFDTLNPTVFTTATRVNVQCGGSWSANGNFAPTTGSATFNGGTAQSASPLGSATSLSFFDLVVATGTTLQIATATDLALLGAMTVQANATLSSASLALVTVAGGWTGTGTTSLPSAQIQVGGACSLVAGGSTTLGPGKVHTFQAGLTVAHALQPGVGSLVRMQGTGTVSSSGLGSLVDLEVVGTYTLGGLTILGSLEYPVAATGTLTVQGGQTVLVNGNANLLGSRLNGSSATAGTLNVRGNLVIDTVNPTTFAASTRLNLLCGGSWSAGSSFAPTIGSVTLNGTGIQPALPAGSASSLAFFDLVVSTGSTVQISGATSMAVLGALTVQSGATLSSGTLTVVTVAGSWTSSGTTSLTSSRIEVTGAFHLSGTGSTTLGAGQVHTFGAGLTVAHALQVGVGSTVRLLGTGTFSTTGSVSVGTLEVAGGYTLGGMTIQGDLIYPVTATADLLLTGGQTILVTGNASLLGSRVNGTSATAATLDVRGNVLMDTVNPTTFANRVDIVCGGGWSSSSTFAPVSGTITCNGGVAQAATPLGASSALSLVNLTVTGGGALQIVNATTLTLSGNLTIDAGSSLTGASLGLVVVGGAWTSSGITSLTGAEIRCTGACALLAGGSTTLGAGKIHRLSSSLDVGHPMQVGAGSFCRMEGGAFVRSSGPNSLPSTAIAGTYIASGFSSLNGDILIEASGSLLFSESSLMVSGNATILGSMGGLGGFQVAGDVTMTPNTIFQPGPLSSTVSIACGGDWVSNANFQRVPVFFSGVGPQLVTVNGSLMGNIVVAGTSAVSFALPDLVVRGDISVGGSLAFPNGTMDVSFGITVLPGASIDVPGGTYTFGGGITMDGTVTGSGLIVYAGVGTIRGTGVIPRLRIATPFTVALGNGSIGQLDVASGTLNMISGATVQVLGNASLLAGTLNGASGAVFDVNGDLLIDNVVAGSTPPTIRLAGNYTSGLPFRPGLLQLDTASLHKIDSIPARGEVRFTDIQLQGGTMLIGNPSGISATSISVAAGTLFDVPPGSFTASSVAIGLAGEMRLQSGADFSLGDGSSIAVASGGTLSLMGSSGARSILRASPGGSWRVSCSGMLRGREFELLGLQGYRSALDRGGLTILPGCSLAAAPNDFSDGVLEGSSTDPFGALISLQSGGSLDFYDLTLRRTGPIAFYGAVTADLAPAGYRFHRYDGDLAGEANEDDPNAIVDWVDAGRTTLESAAARSGFQEIAVAFQSEVEIDTASFEVWRTSTTLPQPVLVATLPALGSPSAGHAYLFTDAGITDAERRFYEIRDVRNGRPGRRLTEVGARSWQAQNGNSFFVGSGGYADVASALAAATDGATIVLGAGTHAAFTLNRPVQIVAAEPGAVVIDTSVSPLVIRDLGIGSLDVSLVGVTVGSTTSSFGLELVNCDGIVVLDDVRARSNTVGLRVDDCPRVALQAVECRGATAMEVVSNSTVFVTGGDIPSATISSASVVKCAGVQLGSSTVDATSLLVPLAEAPPRLQTDSLWSGLQQYELAVTAAPGDIYAVYLDTNRFFADFSPFLPIQGVALVDPGTATSFVSGFVGAAGLEASGVVCPEFSFAWGSTVSFQVLVIRPTAANPFVLGNVRDVVLMP